MRLPGFMVALWCVCVTAGAAAAQESGVRVFVVPKIGVFTAVSTLAEFKDRDFINCEFGPCVIDDCDFDRNVDNDEFDRCEFDLEGGPAIGLALEITPHNSRFGARLNLDYATGSELTLHGETLSDEDNTVLVVTGDVLYRVTGDPEVRPYLLGGLGLKHYDLNVPVISELDGGATDFTLRAGVGVEINVGFGAVIAEASDYISWFKPEVRGSSKMQNDIFGLVGIRIGF